MGNTGRKIYPWLIQVDDSGNPTGLRKPNVPGDPDYIQPYANYTDCPLPTTTTTTSSTTTTTTTAAPTTTTSTTAAPTTTTTTTAAPTTTTTTAAPTTTTTTTISTTTTTTTTAAPPTTLVEIANQKTAGSAQQITDVQINGVTMNPLTTSSFPIVAGSAGAANRPEYGSTITFEVFYHNLIGGETIELVDSVGSLQSSLIMPGIPNGSVVFTGCTMNGTGMTIRLY